MASSAYAMFVQPVFLFCQRTVIVLAELASAYGSSSYSTRAPRTCCKHRSRSATAVVAAIRVAMGNSGSPTELQEEAQIVLSTHELKYSIAVGAGDERCVQA